MFSFGLLPCWFGQQCVANVLASGCGLVMTPTMVMCGTRERAGTVVPKNHAGDLMLASIMGKALDPEPRVNARAMDLLIAFIRFDHHQTAPTPPSTENH